jgi:hypothetical protein
MTMGPRVIARLAVLLAGLALLFVIGHNWPRDQTVHYVLGDASPRVEELRVRYGAAARPSEARDRPQNQEQNEEADWDREARFQWPPGDAPRVVTHAPRLADGDYMVEIEVVANAERNTVKRHVKLESGGSTSIDLAQAVPR